MWPCRVTSLRAFNSDIPRQEYGVILCSQEVVWLIQQGSLYYQPQKLPYTEFASSLIPPKIGVLEWPLFKLWLPGKSSTCYASKWWGNPTGALFSHRKQGHKSAKNHAYDPSSWTSCPSRFEMIWGYQQIDLKVKHLVNMLTLSGDPGKAKTIQSVSMLRFPRSIPWTPNDLGIEMIAINAVVDEGFDMNKHGFCSLKTWTKHINCICLGDELFVSFEIVHFNGTMIWGMRRSITICCLAARIFAACWIRSTQFTIT